MVVTVEPGCYFNPFLLHPAFEDPAQGPFLNKRRLEASLVGLSISPFFAVKKKAMGKEHYPLHPVHPTT